VRAWRPALRRSRGLRLERRTYVLGALAFGSTAAVIGGELAYVWRRGSAPLPADTDDLLGAAEEAARETVEVAVQGYRTVSTRENALFNLLISYTLTFLTIRATTRLIRDRGEFGPFRSVRVGRRHIHHFVPGIAMAFLSGGTAVTSRTPRFDRWLAIPFGAGVALTLDESALLLELDDVYWTEEGIVSVQIGLVASAMLATLALARRLLARGEQIVLPADGGEGPGPVHRAEAPGA
jgi:hypothetical protein